MRNFLKNPLRFKFSRRIIGDRHIPNYIQLPSYVWNKFAINTVQNKDVYKNVKHSCEIVKNIYLSLESSKILKPGCTTQLIDDLVFSKCIEYKVYPSNLGYKGFPKSVCTSVNDIACHGIPGNITLVNGDMVSVDITVFNGEAYGDSCKTYIIGEGSEEDKRLIEATKDCLSKAIDVCGSDQCMSVIGVAIESSAIEWGASIIRNITGHGIGTSLHQKPEILHYKNDGKVKMQTGMIFTIEPCLTFGSTKVFIDDDKWSVRTSDGSKTAQFEHTICICDDGCEILT